MRLPPLIYLATMDKLKITYENEITVPMVQGNLQLIMKLFEKKECSKWQVLFMRQNTRFLRGWHLDKKPIGNNVVVVFLLSYIFISA